MLSVTGRCDGLCRTTLLAHRVFGEWPSVVRAERAEMTSGTTALLGFGVTLAACPVVLRAIRHRIVDHPGDRSSHDRATPRGGGLAVALGAVTALLVASEMGRWSVSVSVIAGAFALLGFIDDVRPLPAFVRLGAQFLIASAAVPLLLFDLSGPTAWQFLFTCGVVLWLVSYVNAFNFMDGINGIAAAQVMVAGMAWWAIGRSENIDALATGGLIIACCAAAFGPFNYPRARMFLGDVGSYFLGAWLAVLVVVGLRSELPIEAVLGPVTIALADTMFTIVRRLRAGATWYEPHREHVYQRLVRAGWSHTVTTAFVALVAAGASAAGFITIAYEEPPARLLADVALVAVLALYLYSPAMAAGLGDRRPAPVGQT